MKVDLLDPVVAAAPGDTATCRVRVVNDSVGPASYRVRMVGLHDEDSDYAVGDDVVPAGGTVDFDVDIQVPRAFAAGRHSLAVEVRSDRRDDRPTLRGVTVEVSSIQQVSMVIDPSTIVGRTRGKFEVAIDNREKRPVDLELTGEGRQLRVELSKTRVTVAPGSTEYVSGKVRGPRRIVRDPVQHVLTVLAEGRSAPVYVEAAYRQQPLFPRRLRTGIAFLVILGLWASILGVGALWIANRDDREPVTAIGQALAPNNTLDPLGENGSGDGTEGQAGTGSGSEAGGDAGTGADGGSAEGGGPQQTAAGASSTTVSGTVKAVGSPADVRVSLAPTLLGKTADSASQTSALSSGGGGEARPAKLWSSLYGRSSAPGVSETVRTLSIETDFTDDKGAWAFPNVLIPDNYEINFYKEGFDSQSFVITPPEDGSAVELEVEMNPATGTASGTVSGPSGPLGGVEIVMTDGELRFSTTSSTDGQGRWELGGLSTPNVYTLTASKRGYGTEVVQVDMDPGEQATPQIRMEIGVGSIGGRIMAAGASLGGVTVKVSGGDLERTTTSLTQGDVGSFDFPQLPVPGIYTITASAPGYVTQSREIRLSGATSIPPFFLSRTTATLTGRVLSNVSGPLPNVGITVRREDLAFKSATASEITATAPSVGSYRIEELPPGSYVVSFERYDHQTQSVLVELAAGETRSLDDIVLQFQSRSALDQDGSLFLEIHNSDGDPLTGATVTLLRVSDGEVVATQADVLEEQSSFEFLDVPIGTYTVRVARKNYRTAERRVTVGLSEVRPQPFQLLRLGQVTGRVVDSITGEQLRNYQLRIWRLNEDGSRASTIPEDTIIVSGGQAPDNDGNILWQSKPNSLTDGLYEVELFDAPPGYRVLADQVISDSASTAPMRFRILPTDEDSVRLNDIEADPYPMVQGRIFTPLLTLPSTSFGGNQVAFAALPGAATVTLSCVGSTTPINAQFFDEVPGVPGLDTFRFTRDRTEANNLIGDCTLTLIAPGFDTATVALTGLAPSDGSTPTDQNVNVALSRDEPAIAGQVYWIDEGNGSAKMSVDGAFATTGPEVIIGYSSSSTPLDSDDVVRAPAPLTTTSIAGSWALDGQVFGMSQYTFTKDGYEDTLFTITINESGRIVDFNAPNLIEEAADAGKTLTVYMRPKTVTNGVSQSVVIQTKRPAPLYNTVDVTLDGPTTAPTVVQPDGAGNVTVASAQPGTWTTSVATPPHHILDPNAHPSATGPITASGVLMPSLGLAPTDLLRFDPVTYIELASIDVTVQDQSGNAIVADIDNDSVPDRPLVSLTRQATAVPGDPGATTFPDQTVNDTTKLTSFPDLAVNTTRPVDDIAKYHLSTEFPGYDSESMTATVSIDGVSIGTYKPSDIPVDLLAGQKATVVITLPLFGGIRGHVLGQIGPSATDPREALPVDDDGVAPLGLTVTATRLYDLAGTPVSDTPLTATADGSGFAINGSPGWYRVVADHPNFLLAPFAVPPSTPLIPRPGGVPSDLYLLQNRSSGGGPDTNNPVLTDPFVLQAAPSIITVQALEADGISPFTLGASVELIPSTGTAPPVQTTSPTGIATFTGLVPERAYAARITYVNPGTLKSERFPVEVTLTAPRGARADDATRTITAKVRLLRVGVGIDVTIESNNGVGIPPTAFALPEDVLVSRSYQGAATPEEDRVVVVGPGGSTTTIDNSATEDDLDPVPDQSELLVRDSFTPELPVTYRFSGLPFGIHDFTFSDEDGYVTPNPAPVLLSSVAVVPLTVNYQPALVDLVVTLHSDDPTTIPVETSPIVTSATVTLNSPQGGSTTIQRDPVGDVYRFDDLLPLGDPYTLTIVDPTHEEPATPVEVTIGVEPSGQKSIDVALTRDASQLTGLVTKRDTEGGTPSPLGVIGSARLFSLTSNTYVAGPQTLTSEGRYTFDNVDPGNYRIDITAGGYAPRSGETDVALGQSTGPTISPLPKLAAVDITIAGPAATASDLTITLTAPASPSLPPGTCAVADPTCTLSSLDPEQLYSWKVTATDVYDTFIPGPAASATFDPQVGKTDHTLTVTPDQRRVQVTVTELDDDNDPVSNGGRSATVTLGIPTITASSPSITGSGSSNVYTFPTSSSTRFSFGTGQISVANANFRTKVVALSATTATSSTHLETVGVSVKPNVRLNGQVKKNATTNLNKAVTVVATPVVGGVLVPGSAISVTSNNQGEYSFSGSKRLGVGLWEISTDVSGSGDDQKRVNITADTVTTNFGITGEATTTESRAEQDLILQVRLIDFNFTVTSGGNGIGGALVTIGTKTGTTSSAADSTRGKVTITNVPEDNLEYFVSASGFVTSATETASASNRNITVTLDRAPFNVTVNDGTLGGLAGATVLLCDNTFPTSACTAGGSAEIVQGTAGGTAGSYTITPLNTGRIYRLKAIKGAKTAETTITVPLNSGFTTAQTLTVLPPAITGTVTDGGTGVNSATVYLCASGPCGSANKLTDVASNGSGVYSIVPPSSAGTYSLTAVKDAKMFSTTFTIDANGVVTPAGAINLPLATLPAIAGKVTDGGSDLVGADVYLCPSGTVTCNASTDIQTTQSVAAGAYSIQPTYNGLAASYVLSAISGTKSYQTTVSVAANGAITPTPPINLAVVAPTITGSVAGGVSGANIYLCSSAACSSSNDLTTAVSNGGGSYTITVPGTAGTYYLVAMNGTQSSPASTFTAATGGAVNFTSGTSTLTLAAATLTGTITDAGAPVSGAFAYVCASAQTECTSGNALATSLATASNGVYTVTLPTPATTYKVTAVSGSKKSPTSAFTANEGGSTTFTTGTANLAVV